MCIRDRVAARDPDVLWWAGHGDGSFGPEHRIQAPLSSTLRYMLAGDFNADVVTDLLLMGPSTVAWLRGQPGGTFEAPVPIARSPLPDSTLTSVGIARVDARDVDGDGFADAVISFSTSQDLSLIH